MAFNTTSYLAGVGSVVAALTIGFSSGFFFAAPKQNDPPNRLQRVASTAPLSNPVSAPAAPAPKQEIPTQDIATAAPTTSAATTAPIAASTPVVVAPSPSTTASVVAPAPGTQQLPPPEPQSGVTRSSEPAPSAAERERIAQIKAEPAEKLSAAEASRAAEKKRIEARKLAERQRRQREVQEAAAAVKRMLRDRDVQQVSNRDEVGFDTPRFGFFGQ